MIEMAKNFNLSVDERGIEEILKVILEEFTQKKLLAMKYKCIAEKGARKIETAERKQTNTQTIYSKSVSSKFCKAQKSSLESLKT